MTSYAPVAVTGNVVEGPQQQRSPEGDRFNGAFGVRRAWWWQAGPVDSCCFCFSLGTGVALTAMDCLLSSMWCFFFGRAYQASVFEDLLAMLQEQYARSCEGSAASTADCEQLKASMEQTEGFVDDVLHYPMVTYYVQAVLGIVAGVFGILAVYFKHTRAAKVYMLTWPAKIIVALWGALELRSLYAKHDMDQGPIGIVYLINSFILLYYFKVAWSYYKRRLEYSYDAPPRRVAASGTVNHSTPMLAMNTNV